MKMISLKPHQLKMTNSYFENIVSSWIWNVYIIHRQREQSELPEHRFVEKDSRTTLYIEDYIFRRRYIRKDSATFTCTACENLETWRKDGTQKGCLCRRSHHKWRICLAGGWLGWRTQMLTSGFNVITKEAREEMFARVEENPTQKIPRIYLEVRSKYMENLTQIQELLSIRNSQCTEPFRAALTRRSTSLYQEIQ